MKKRWMDSEFLVSGLLFTPVPGYGYQLPFSMGTFDTIPDINDVRKGSDMVPLKVYMNTAGSGESYSHDL